MSKPREWILNTRDKIVNENNGIVVYQGTPPPVSEIVHVIEKSAYDDLLKEVEELEASLAKLQATNEEFFFDMQELMSQNLEIKAESVFLKKKLEEEMKNDVSK